MVKGFELFIYMQYSRIVWEVFFSKNRGSWKMCQSLEIPSYLPHPASVKETVHLLYNYRMINRTISINKRKDLPMRSAVLVLYLLNCQAVANNADIPSSGCFIFDFKRSYVTFCDSVCQLFSKF